MAIQWRLDGDMKAIKYLVEEIKRQEWRRQELSNLVLRHNSDSEKIRMAAWHADEEKQSSIYYTPEKIVEMLQEYHKMNESMTKTASELNCTDNVSSDAQNAIVRFFNWASNNQETYPIITKLLIKYQNEK